MKRLKYGLLAVVGLITTLSACKPTENNYRAAYQAALSKRDAANDDAASLGLVLEGQPQWQKVGTDSVMVLRQPLARLTQDSAPVKQYNVAVAAYSMRTNAAAHTERLIADGYDARMLKNGDNQYLAIAAQFDSIQPAVSFIARYMSRHPHDMYAGLPGRPVVEIPSNLFR